MARESTPADPARKLGARAGLGVPRPSSQKGVGVFVGTRQPASVPATHPQPGARTPRCAHVVWPRLQERAARGLGSAREGRRPPASQPSPAPSAPHGPSRGAGRGWTRPGPCRTPPCSLLADTLFNASRSPRGAGQRVAASRSPAAHPAGSSGREAESGARGRR